MKIEKLGITVSIVLVCLLTFMPVKRSNVIVNDNLSAASRDISYNEEHKIDSEDVENVLEKINYQDLKKKIKKYIKEHMPVEEKKQEKKKENKNTKQEVKKQESTVKKEVKTEKKKKTKTEKKVFDNMTMSQLSAKLNKSLNSTLSNKGGVFAKYSVKYGVDPYLAVAIALHETGCSWDCSTLVKKCNNVGGQKGSPGCGGGSYKYYSTLDAGIEGFISNIYYNYYKYGLNTAEKMNSKYAASSSWAVQVNSYINSIKSK